MAQRVSLLSLPVWDVFKNKCAGVRQFFYTSVFMQRIG